MRRLDKLPASAFRRATRVESAKLGVPYSAKRYLPDMTKLVKSNTRTISEREYHAKREGVTVEAAIAERKRGVRPYQSPASHIRAQRAIERNRRDPVRAHVRKKKASGQRISEREFAKANQWYLDIVEKKSGIRWQLVKGEWAWRLPLDGDARARLRRSGDAWSVTPRDSRLANRSRVRRGALD